MLFRIDVGLLLFSGGLVLLQNFYPALATSLCSLLSILWYGPGKRLFKS